MTVAEFLTARLDEAEETVHREVRFCEATGREVKDWGKYVYDPVIGPYGGQSRMRDAATGIYIAKVADPTRLLADIAAKKRILANYIEWQGNPFADRGPADEWLLSARSAYTAVVMDLVQQFHDHPEFDPAWRIT
jgi:hypothetical protein